MASKNKWPTGCRLWYTADIGGTKWPVLLADESFEHICGNEGVCLFDHGLIVINDALSEDRREAALVHELLHATLWVSGNYRSLQQLLGSTDDDEWEAQEENIVNLVSQNMFDTLKRNGWLKFKPTRKPRAA